MIYPKHKGGQTREENLERLAPISLSFYKDHLEGNGSLMRACEDRLRLVEEIHVWKDVQRQKGIVHTSCSPCHMIYSLEQTHQLVMTHRLGEESFLIWNDQQDSNIATTPEGLARHVVQRVRDHRKELERNRNGIDIGQITFGVADSAARIRQGLHQDIQIHNANPHPVQIVIQDDIAQKRNLIVDDPKNFVVHSGDIAIVSFSFIPRVVGVLKTLVTFDITPLDQQSYDNTNPKKPFSIVRYIQVRSGNPDDYAILKPISPYKKKVAIEAGGFSSNRMTIPKTSIGSSRRGFLVKLKNYGIPDHWRKSLQANPEEEGAEDILMGLYHRNGGPGTTSAAPMHLFQSFTQDNYAPIFHRLLWTEEAQMEIDIKQYDMENKSMTKRGKYWSLFVPLLAESRPSVLRGDIILIRLHGDKKESFEGMVHKVELEHAIIEFPLKFSINYIEGLGIDVRFTFKRMNLRTSHQAVDDICTQQIMNTTFQNQSFSFSTPLIHNTQCQNLAWFNRDLNPEQRTAIKGVLASEARPSPYLIYGPPGTGKTVTVVETILQTVKLSGSSARILVCAPSNAAADLLCERLAEILDKGMMTRIIAYSREKSAVSKVVMKFTHYNEEEGAFVCPPVDELKKKIVVIMTISTSGKNPNIGLKDHFTHVFVDEAGHVTEPELTGCFGAVKESPVVVLAGDPKQLGPIIRSGQAKALGLEMSLLERLSKCKSYERQNEGTYDTRVCTKLVRNYRSHPSILKVPNRLFYNDDLIVSADVFDTHAFQNWEYLPTKGFPIIFHGVEGVDDREGNSPSFFNSEEATIVKEYVELLVKGTRANRCKAEEIGIVTPYHKQVQKIRKLMHSKNYDTKVGSVDEFQGSERRVIIISTVRSSVDHIQFDKKHRLGFVANEKRFNVAITRAKALLIVVGNPFLLEKDKNWYELIKFCMDNGGYTGCRFELGERDDINVDVDNALKGIASMKVVDDEDSDVDDSSIIDERISAITALEQPEWRREE